MSIKLGKWLAAALMLASMSAPHAGILSGSFSGKAYDALMYVGPNGPWYPEPVSIDGTTVTGTFSMHTGNFIKTGQNGNSAFFKLPPFEIEFFAAGHHIQFDRDQSLFQPYFVLTQTPTYQQISFDLGLHKDDVTFKLRAAPDTLFTNLDPHTLKSGVVDAANSVAGFRDWGGSLIIEGMIALESVVFDGHQVPAPDSLLLTGLGLLALGVGLRRTRRDAADASAD